MSDKLRCAQRELKLRREVYPRWVMNKKMDALKADYEIKLMEAIVRDYEEWSKNERLL